MSATATAPPSCLGGWTAAGSRGCGMAGWTRATVGRSWSGCRPRWGSPWRWRSGLPAGAEPPEVPAFAVVPRRWVVERNFGWLGRFRRLSKDYEFLPATSEAVIYLAMTQILTRRLAGR